MKKTLDAGKQALREFTLKQIDGMGECRPCYYCGGPRGGAHDWACKSCLDEARRLRDKEGGQR